MARALLVVHRAGAERRDVAAYLDVLNRRLTPDNVTPRKPAVAEADGVTSVVFNPSGATRIRAGSICIGALFGSSADWHRPGPLRPEGCYGVLRSDRQYVELVADATASRTVWYTLTPDLFIASTSQRAIVTLLGRFEPNPSAIAWMLSSGTLGPEAAWDLRLRQVLPGERITLDRTSWRLTHDIDPADFAPTIPSEYPHLAKQFADTLEAALRQYVFDTSKWAFLLSGGVDSRGLLSLLGPRVGIRTVTWGVSTSPRQAWNDARVARRVAAQLGLENRFFSVDLLEEPREKLIRRFLVAGEGRVANISPFVDGFGLWKRLHEEGFDGVIRGDEGFGSRFVRNEYEVRNATKLTMLEDYFHEDEIAAFGLPHQFLPWRLAPRRAETLATWRDRLYQQNRLPKFLAGLTDLQSPYVEVVNPLLAYTVLRCVRTLPDHLRTNKRLWREFAQSKSLPTPLARRSAVLPLQRFVSDTDLLTLMLAELETHQERDALGGVLRATVCASIRAALAVGAD
ncbi:MAG TPA: asparagine synthase-related protein, partial [Vicinamibacterales bacterium]|nr:asparagine synthase-related protein [Vicinamibacterales bacterium]